MSIQIGSVQMRGSAARHFATISSPPRGEAIPIAWRGEFELSDGTTLSYGDECLITLEDGSEIPVQVTGILHEPGRMPVHVFERLAHTPDESDSELPSL